MGVACISRILLLCLLLFCFSSNGFGRKLVHTSVRENHNHLIVTAASELHLLITQGKSREMIQLDYADTGPNFNGRSVYPLPSLSQPPPPPPPPPPQSGF